MIMTAEARLMASHQLLKCHVFESAHRYESWQLEHCTVSQPREQGKT